MKRMCRLCRVRPAKFSVRGGPVKADKTHDLCFRCNRSVKDSMRTKDNEEEAADGRRRK